MKAMVCEAFGGPETLAWRDLPDPPPPQPGEIQVKLLAREALQAVIDRQVIGKAVLVG